MSKLSDESKADSKKKETELKEVVRAMVTAGIPVTSAEVERLTGLSHSFVYKPEIQKFIKEQQEKQKEEGLRVDIGLQKQNLYTKLMASYIFAYSLLDEQEEFYKTAISELKGRSTPFVLQKNNSSIDFACQVLSNEADAANATAILNNFQMIFASDIPDWKDQMMKKLGKCPAFDILNQMADGKE